MQLRTWHVGSSLAVLMWSAAFAQPANQLPRVAVVVGEHAPQLDRFAASELCGYLEKLFQIHVQPATRVPGPVDAVFLIGNPQTNPEVKLATARQPFPPVSDQGIVLRRTEYDQLPALIVGGGSPAATLWAVYELAERWGVRFLMEGDVIPAIHGKFAVPDLNVEMEPVFRVRGHPTIQDFAASGESWGINDFRLLIAQLAKLKFNRLNLYAFGWQPYLDWECKGIKRGSAWLWYGYQYPIRPDMPGRSLFGNAYAFWSPDLPLNSSYHDLVTAGQRQFHQLIDYAHQHGMECAVTAPVTDFPPEFAPLVNGAVVSNQLGGLTVVPGPTTPLDDPGLRDVALACLRATVNEYSQADYVTVYMPEFRQWTGEYKRAWQSLDEKYGISKVVSLDQVLDAAAHRKGGSWTPDRAINQVEGDIASLYFYERLLQNSNPLLNSWNPKIKFIYEGVTEELFPILDRIIPRGWELSSMPDGNLSHLLERPEIIRQLPAREVPAVMDLTLDDDNIGVMPQITTESLYQIVQEMQRAGWAGMTARERFPGDHDSTLAYLARAAWDRHATPDGVIGDQLDAVCGHACAQDMLAALHDVDKVRVVFEHHDSAFAFPAEWPPATALSPGGMLLKYYRYANHGPVPAYLDEIRDGYRQALAEASQALAKSTPEGRRYVNFWVGRLKFAVGYLDTVEEIERASISQTGKNHEAAVKELYGALATLHDAVDSYASVARNQSDRGAIAVVDEDGYHALSVFAWHLFTWGY